MILGIDPGFARVGWSFVVGGAKVSLVDFGCWETESSEAYSRRLEKIYRNVSGLIREYSPKSVAVEKLFFHTNQKTVIDVAQARGVVLLAAAHHEVAVYEYTPLQIKMALTGYGRADKLQMQKMVQTIFGLTEIPQPDDAADALAVAYCHSVNSKVE
jgi:crossover junction endodeoxyribonuclease RuvC